MAFLTVLLPIKITGLVGWCTALREETRWGLVMVERSGKERKLREMEYETKRKGKREILDGERGYKQETEMMLERRDRMSEKGKMR